MECEYWKTRSEEYNNLEWVNNDLLLKSIGDIIDYSEDMNVLDVGTGTGKVLIYLSLVKGIANYYGFDISEDMLKKIDDKYELKLDVADVLNLEIYNDDFFHFAIARMVFHHVKEPFVAMTEVYKKIKKGGYFIMCEGNPPSYNSHGFYKEMFSYKEDRDVYMESDLINLFIKSGFKNILTKTVILEKMSLNNWIDNCGISDENKKIIKDMHYKCSDSVKEDYNMIIQDEDILMDWKFSIVIGEK